MYLFCTLLDIDTGRSPSTYVACIRNPPLHSLVIVILGKLLTKLSHLDSCGKHVGKIANFQNITPGKSISLDICEHIFDKRYLISKTWKKCERTLFQTSSLLKEVSSLCFWKIFNLKFRRLRENPWSAVMAQWARTPSSKSIPQKSFIEALPGTIRMLHNAGVRWCPPLFLGGWPHS